MKQLKHNVLLRIIKMWNVIMITLPFYCCWYGFYASEIEVPFYRRGNWVIISIFVILYIFFIRIYDGLQLQINRISDLIYSQILSALISDGIMYIAIVVLAKRFTNLLPGIAAIGGQIFLSIIWSYFAHKIYFKLFKPQNTCIIYDKRKGIEQLIKDYNMVKKFDVQKILDSINCLTDLSILDSFSVVFLSGITINERNTILKYCIANDKYVYAIPSISDLLMASGEKVHMLHLPFLRVSHVNLQPEYLFIKRFFDILISLIAIVILSPIFLITAISIKVTDNGPIFYKQRRLTQNGRIFKLVKFRSMKVDAEKDGVARLSTGDKDNRITKIGRVIRKLRIDELPQFFNILSGSMSIVGPRPERPEIASDYEKTLPEFKLRLQVKAGLTGYAQVYGKYNTTPYDKLLMDLIYISKPSVFEDLKIIFATIKIIFMPESTEGIEEGQTTANNVSDIENKF